MNQEKRTLNQNDQETPKNIDVVQKNKPTEVLSTEEEKAKIDSENQKEKEHKEKIIQTKEKVLKHFDGNNEEEKRLIEEANELRNSFEPDKKMTYTGLRHEFLELATEDWKSLSAPYPIAIYETNTSNGENIKVTDYGKGFFIAENHQGEVVGLRVLRGENWGFITVKDTERGKGVASAIETLMDKYMEKKGGVWKIQNSNKRFLEKLEKEYINNPSPVLAKAIELQKQDQENWLRLYGEDGKLGFKKIDDENYEKDYVKNETEDPLAPYLIKTLEEPEEGGTHEEKEKIWEEKIQAIQEKIYDK